MKCPRLLRSSQDTVWPKTNRHSDEIKGGAEAPEDIEEATHDLLQVLISSSCVFSSAALSLPRPVMVIYLVGKGPLFLTGKSSARTRQESSEDGRDRASERTQGGGGNISPARVSQVTTTISLAAVMELELWPQAVREEEEKEKRRITCQYLFPQAAWIETDTLHSLSLPPEAGSRALPLFGIKRT